MPEHWTPVFLAALAAAPNVSAAAAAAGVERSTAYRRREADPEFAAAWDDAIAQSTDALVGEIYRRAVHGTEKPVFYQGEECGLVREYSDTLAIFLAKAHRRDVYGDRHDITSGGKPLGQLGAALSSLKESDLAALERIGEALSAGPGGLPEGSPG